MANFTENAIKESFIKLLAEKPLSKISVKDIVEDCGINRNSFYYHFHDIPELLEKLIIESAETIISQYPSIDSVEQCVNVAIEFSLQYKKALLHIFNSVNRDIYEQNLMKVCDHVVRAYLNKAFKDTEVKDADKEAGITFIKCLTFGLIIDWMSMGMDAEAPRDCYRVLELCRGISDEIIARSAGPRK
ncbi:MAG: TetR/AcrR family transcriptional regulator C-terminal domain-containing protein [Lachnospiraceae bacterium]|nr:TetR/AcrR family transcriptional regulator C-terminal domain-containing protein [Lachnospiraceae bacterium]